MTVHKIYLYNKVKKINLNLLEKSSILQLSKIGVKNNVILIYGQSMKTATFSVHILLLFLDIKLNKN